ncbi:MAG: hypothetical protein EF806_04620 [Candidatus Methanoliparum thermophilum]|uniref:Uncharacterized protein n=1 Tax=Methanoliparum thermophilum TaxID=2491083 RepID=A0A520KS67_METT2|nr:MAG: hypothetical protein EF806_04620 [Candidatus Methanoliparum thermophilum]BDC35759.1 hypothetical protein MTLP_04410 [Candidatus Methanoliparum sp. LAM-1]
MYRLDYHYKSKLYKYYFSHDPKFWFITDELTLRRKGKKKTSNGENKSDFDLLADVEASIEDEKIIKYYGPINFDPSLGIFFTVPLKNTPIYPIQTYFLHSFREICTGFWGFSLE